MRKKKYLVEGKPILMLKCVIFKIKQWEVQNDVIVCKSRDKEILQNKNFTLFT